MSNLMILLTSIAAGLITAAVILAVTARRGPETRHHQGLIDATDDIVRRRDAELACQDCLDRPATTSIGAVVLCDACAAPIAGDEAP